MGVGVVIYGEKNCKMKNKGVGDVKFMDIFCNIWDKRSGWLFRKHLQKISASVPQFFVDPSPPLD